MIASLSPMNAFLVLTGTETLPLRMRKHCDNALEVARWLKANAKVAWVNYAGLEDHPDHQLMKKYLSGKASGLVSFGVKGPAGSGRDSGARFLDGLKLFNGTVVVVSHDRHFISELATRVVELRPGDVIDFGGTYEEHLERHGQDYMRK